MAETDRHGKRIFPDEANQSNAASTAPFTPYGVILDRATELAKVLPLGHYLKHHVEKFLKDEERARFAAGLTGLGPGSPAMSGPGDDWRIERDRRNAPIAGGAVGCIPLGTKVEVPPAVVGLGASGPHIYDQAIREVDAQNSQLRTTNDQLHFQNDQLRGANYKLHDRIDRSRSLHQLRKQLTTLIDAALDGEIE